MAPDEAVFRQCIGFLALIPNLPAAGLEKLPQHVSPGRGFHEDRLGIIKELHRIDLGGNMAIVIGPTPPGTGVI